jgi:hypothetical protein
MASNISETDLLKKISILEILNRLKDITVAKDLTYYAMQVGAINYFEAQHFIADLIDDGCVELIEFEKTEYLKLTDDGYSFVTTLRDQLPKSWSDSIDIAISSDGVDDDLEIKKTSSVECISANDFLVCLKLEEGTKTLLDLKMVVYSQDQAGLIIERWSDNTGLVYEKLIESLTT